MADGMTIESAMQQAMQAVSPSSDVRPVGASADTTPVEPLTETPDGLRPADATPAKDIVPEVSVEPTVDAAQPPEAPVTPPERKTPEHVPYDRFHEVIQERNEARRRAEEAANYFQNLSPVQRALLENPQLIEDPKRLNAFLYGEQPQQEQIPDFDAIDDPYERADAIKAYELTQEFNQRLKPLAEKLQSIESAQQQDMQMRLEQEGERLLKQETAEIKALPEFVGVTEAEAKVVMNDVMKVAVRYKGQLSLTEAYRLTPHYDRLKERSIAAKLSQAQQTKRETSSPMVQGSGTPQTAPIEARSIHEAFRMAQQRQTG